MLIPDPGYIDDGSLSIMQATASYFGISSAVGAAGGTTIVDVTLATQPSYAGMVVKVLSGSSAGQERRIVGTTIAGTITVDAAFTAAGAPNQITATTRFVITSGYMSDVITSLTTILAAIAALSVAEATPNRTLLETWQDVLGINPSIWSTTNPATGVAWARGIGTGVMADTLVASVAPNASEVTRLVSVQQWPVGPTTWGVNSINKQFHLEFELTISDVANLDNTATIFGLTSVAGGHRGTVNIICFGLIADALQTITDVGGVEEVNTGFGEILANKNKFKIVISEAQVQFYLNETLIATHIVSLPDVPMFINHYFDTEIAGSCTIQIGQVRAWYEDTV